MSLPVTMHFAVSPNQSVRLIIAVVVTTIHGVVLFTLMQIRPIERPSDDRKMVFVEFVAPLKTVGDIASDGDGESIPLPARDPVKPDTPPARSTRPIVAKRSASVSSPEPEVLLASPMARSVDSPVALDAPLHPDPAESTAAEPAAGDDRSTASGSETAGSADPSSAVAGGSGSGGKIGFGGGGGAPRSIAESDLRYRKQVMPTYPVASRRLHETGNVTISVLIDIHGKPVEVALARPSGVTRLDAAALEAARNTRFHPYRESGVATPVRTKILYRFALED